MAANPGVRPDQLDFLLTVVITDHWDPYLFWSASFCRLNGSSARTINIMRFMKFRSCTSLKGTRGHRRSPAGCDLSAHPST